MHRNVVKVIAFYYVYAAHTTFVGEKLELSIRRSI